jgi:hypothetical protein
MNTIGASSPELLLFFYKKTRIIFSHNYTMFIDKAEAFRIIKDIEYGFCHGPCRSAWVRNLKYALKTKTNPLKLTADERTRLRSELKRISGKRYSPAPPEIEELARFRKIYRYQNGGKYYKLTSAQDKILDAFIKKRRLALRI